MESEAHLTGGIRDEVFTKDPDDIWHACQAGNIDLLQKIINELWIWEKSESVNKKSSEGWTGLSLAVAYGHLCVILLLKNKANPDIVDNSKYCPMHWAAKTGNLVAKQIGGLGAMERKTGLSITYPATKNPQPKNLLTPDCAKVLTLP
ncbi:MAG: ankyrin repeat domain-containing protein [Parachlamydiaceae bacterium]|nr:ankyrin repeat domain-containing protein [Parachlamydiaceae bacterium]